jgi:hypothetical protein
MGHWAKIFLVLVVFCGACGSSSTLRSLKTTQDVKIGEGDAKEVELKAGETRPLSSTEVTRVERPGYIGVVLVPLQTASPSVEVTLRKIDTWGGDELYQEVNQRLNALLPKMIEAQRALASGKAREALMLVDGLQTQYPQLTYLNFMRASALFVLGDRDKALGALDIALSSFPDNAAGLSLRKTLTSETTRR